MLNQTPEELAESSLNQVRSLLVSILSDIVLTIKEESPVRRIEIECFRMLNQVCSIEKGENGNYYAMQIMSNYNEEVEHPFDLIVGQLEKSEKTAWTIEQIKDFLASYVESIVKILSTFINEDEVDQREEFALLTNLEIPALNFVKNVAENGKDLHLLIEKLEKRQLLQQSMMDLMGDESSDLDLLNKLIGKIQ
jgi:hypothetical protein